MKSTTNKLENNLKNRSTKTLVILTALLLFIIQLNIAQTVYTVDNRPESGAQYTTVQAAINAAIDGDIIYIHPSPTSYGNINIDRTLTLVGPGHDPANSDGLMATLGNITLRANSINTELIGLNIGSVDAYSFGANSHNIHIINNRISNDIRGNFTAGESDNWVIEGNYFNSSYNNTNIHANTLNNVQIRNNILNGTISNLNRTAVVTNNLFIHEDTTGSSTIFTSVDDITSPIVTNNMFVFTDPDITGLVNSGSTPVVYTNCLTWKEAGGVALTALNGSGNIDNMNPLFNNIPTSVNDFYNNDYTLGGSSLAIGTATDGGDIGVFGRGFPFDIHGRPNSMSYPTEMVILNTVVQPGQTLNVTFKASQKN